ncbi:MAG: hypothetical protein ACOX2F_06375 [bacterium]
MKKILMFQILLLTAFSLHGQVYELVERTATFGPIPVLSDTNERTDGYFLPSLLAANKKGYGYIDSNFTKGGLIVPMLNKTLMGAVWYEHGSRRNMVDIKEIMKIFEPDLDVVPVTKHLMGLAFGANINDKVALGLNFRYLLGRYYEKNSISGRDSSHKIDTNRIEVNPSLTFRTEKLFADIGFTVNHQWMSEKAVGNFEYNRTTTYDQNTDFTLFGRIGFKATQYFDVVLGTGFGMLPLSEHVLGDGFNKIGKIEHDSYFWNFKAASVIKPTSWMRIHPAVIFSLYRFDATEENFRNSEVESSKANQFHLTMTLGLDITPLDWLAIKAGVMKNFILFNDETGLKIVARSTAEAVFAETLDAYLGPSFTVKGFTFTSLINLRFFTDGPYIITGKELTDWAYVATVEYQW